MPPRTIADRAAELTAAQRAIRRSIRAAIAAGSQQTAAARRSPRTITVSIPEALALISAAAPATALDVVQQQRHALIVISLRHALDQLTRSGADDSASLAAVKLLGRTTRLWLRQAAKMAEREAEQARQAQRNIITLTRPVLPVCPIVFTKRTG